MTRQLPVETSPALGQATPRRGPPPPAAGPGPPRRRTWRRALRRDWQLYSLAILPLAFFLIFRYLPMIGNVIAFRRFVPGGNISRRRFLARLMFRSLPIS